MSAITRFIPEKQTRRKLGKGVKTIWQYARELFSVSGVNGVSHIAVAKTPVRRVLWTAIFAFSVCGWFYQTTSLLEYYYKYQTVVQIEVTKIPVMPFPGITICNVNKIRRSELCLSYPEKCINQSIELTEEDIFDITMDYLMEGRKADLGHQLQDMVISCHFTGYPNLDTNECLEYFSLVYIPHYGNCYVLSTIGKNKLTVSEADAWHEIEEMKLLLNIENDEYLNADSETPGIIITLHEDMDYPQIATHGFHVHSDHIYNVAIEKTSVHLLPKPYVTNCTEYKTLPFHTLSKMELTPMICTVECLMYEQKKRCGHGYITDNVVLFVDKMPYDPKQITSEDRKCADELSHTLQHYCKSLCGVPCHDIHYKVNLDSSKVEHSLEIDPEGLAGYESRTSEGKRIYATSLHIHYQTLEHQVLKHQPEFNTETLFSYLGGITGGWLGISLLEFCAFLEGLFSVLLFSFRYCKPQKRNRKKNRKTPKKLDPIREDFQTTCRGECHCRCRPDYGSMVLGMPVPHNTVQIVPFPYY